MRGVSIDIDGYVTNATCGNKTCADSGKHGLDLGPTGGILRRGDFFGWDFKCGSCGMLYSFAEVLGAVGKDH